MDYITIDDLRIHAAHGHYEQERQVEQEFIVSLRVGIDAKNASKSDDLSETIDYDILRAKIQDVFKGKTHYLVEALGEEIATSILQFKLAQEVTVSIKKSAVWPNGIPGIVIHRTK